MYMKNKTNLWYIWIIIEISPKIKGIKSFDLVKEFFNIGQAYKLQPQLSTDFLTLKMVAMLPFPFKPLNVSKFSNLVTALVLTLLVN